MTAWDYTKEIFIFRVLNNLFRLVLFSLVSNPIDKSIGAVKFTVLYCVSENCPGLSQNESGLHPSSCSMSLRGLCTRQLLRYTTTPRAIPYKALFLTHFKNELDPVPWVNSCPEGFCCCVKLDNSYQVSKIGEIF